MSFLFGNFVDGAAVWTRNKIPPAKPKQWDKKQDQSLTEASDISESLIYATAGKVSAKAAAKSACVTGYCEKEKHMGTP